MGVVGRQDLERGRLSRSGERVGVLAQIKRAVDPPILPIVTDSLGY